MVKKIPSPEELLESTEGKHPLRQYLRTKGITIGKLSQVIGHSEAAISRALNGITCSENLRKKLDQVCAAWGVA